MSLNPNICVFNSLYKNLLNSFYERTFVSKYHYITFILTWEIPHTKKKPTKLFSPGCDKD